MQSGFLCVLFSVVLFSSLDAQKPIGNLDSLCWDGEALLVAGKFAEKTINTTDIRIDSNYYPLMHDASVNISLRNIYAYDYSLDGKSQSLLIDDEGIVRGPNRPVRFRPHYWKKSQAKRVFLIGNSTLSSYTQWLDVDLDKGRITRQSDFRNLRMFNNETSNLQPAKDIRLHAISPYEPYPGDPFLWKSLAECSKLSALSIIYRTSHPSICAGNIYMLDEGLGDVLEQNELRSVQVVGLPYLPVNFDRFEYTDYIAVTGSFPELLNLSLVLRHFHKKDTLAFGRYFNNGYAWWLVGDVSELIIPENGTFRTNYVNGARLCEGNYVDGKPDGRWTFSFPNGVVSQERYYHLGAKTGTWVFRNSEGDTLALFNYENDRLVYRKDVGYGSETPCNNREFSYKVRYVTEYSLDWTGGSDVTIRKQMKATILFMYGTGSDKQKGEVIRSLAEKYTYKDEDWSFEREETCIDGSYDFYSAKGMLGSPPFEAYREAREIQNPRSLFYQSTDCFDVKAGTWESTTTKHKGEEVEVDYHDSGTF